MMSFPTKNDHFGGDWGCHHFFWGVYLIGHRSVFFPPDSQ